MPSPGGEERAQTSTNDYVEGAIFRCCRESSISWPYQRSKALPCSQLAGRGFSFAAVRGQVGAQPRQDFLFPALLQFLLQFFQGKVNDIVMVQLFGLNEVAETQPEAMQ